MQTIAQQLKVTDFPFKIKNKNGKTIYFEDSCREWARSEYDSNGREIYYEDYIGNINDKRPKSEVQKALELLEKEGMLVDGKVLKN